MTLERDLERWESGATSTDDLLGLHAEEDLRPLLAVHERMVTAGAVPVALDELALRRVVRGLPGRGPTRRRGRGLLLAVAAVVLSASMAIAVPAVRHGVPSISHLFGPGSASPTGQPTRPEATSGGDATRRPPGASGPAGRPDRRTGGDGQHGDAAATPQEAPGHRPGEHQQGDQGGGAGQGAAQQEDGDQQDPGAGGDEGGGDVNEGSSTNAGDTSGDGQDNEGSPVE